MNNFSCLDAVLSRTSPRQTLTWRGITLLHPRTVCNSKTEAEIYPRGDPSEDSEKRRLETLAENGCDLLHHKQDLNSNDLNNTFNNFNVYN
ncbi:hypothetical protein TNCV_538681 [Trichonephila clavipes]|nr:hypothetical protein TNCV_538681 [Trichonephila clavipes]